MVAQSISSEQSHGCTHCQNGENFSEHKDNNLGTRRNRTFRDGHGGTIAQTCSNFPAASVSLGN